VLGKPRSSRNLVIDPADLFQHAVPELVCLPPDSLEDTAKEAVMMVMVFVSPWHADAVVLDDIVIGVFDLSNVR
jgi:hypothetical protein